MHQERHKLRLPVVFSRVLPWEARQNVPVHLDSQLLGPPHALDILHAGAAFAHDLQHLRAEILDTRLNGTHAAGPQGGKLMSLEVRLDLEEQLQSQATLLEPREQRPDEPNIQ